MGRIRSTPSRTFVLRDLTFQAREGTLRATIPDLKEYASRYKAIPSAEFYWCLNIPMKELAVESTIDGEGVRDYWKPTIYHDHLVIPRMCRWTDLAGQTIRWDSPADENMGIPNGGLYIWEHAGIPDARLRFLERRGRRFRIGWQGHCDVFWNAKYRDHVPFKLDAMIRFTGIEVVGNAKDDNESMRERLAKHLDPSDFTQDPVVKSRIKFDYGVRTIAETTFRPKPRP